MYNGYQPKKATKTESKIPPIICVALVTLIYSASILASPPVAKILINKPNKEGIEYLPFWWFFVMKNSFDFAKIYNLKVMNEFLDLNSFNDK